MMSPHRSIQPFFVLVVCLSVALLTGCATTVTVTRMKPAEVSLPGIRQIAVAGVTGRDGDQLSSLITQRLFDSKRYEVLEREAMDKVMREINKSVDALFTADGLDLGQLLPASALVVGRVQTADVNESVNRERSTCTKTEGTGDKARRVSYVCIQITRTVVATYEADLRVIDTSRGKLLATRRFRHKDSAATRGTDEEPEPIDGEGMLNVAREKVADEFLRMVAPYPVQEKVKLYTDSKLPELAMGNGFAQQAEWQKAQEYYVKAVARGDADPTLKPKTKSQAHYALGVALAFTGDYDAGAAELDKAYGLNPDAAYIEMMARVKQFKSEAAELEKQNADVGTASKGRD